jgi:membrane glycosyltransferase
MLGFLPEQGETPLEISITILFAILFAWISLGFWTAFFGFVSLLTGFDRLTMADALAHPSDMKVELAKTAIVMPIYNEDVPRVYAGLHAIYRSLKEAGVLDHFEFYILSDTNDPDIWVNEEEAWARLQRETGDPERIYYRRRRVNIKRKTGNIADFCRRWGMDFRYMVVLDADSIMSGDTLIRMVQTMERRHQIGILQTAPLTVNRESLYARIQQFANHVYGPLFAAGLHYWQLGDGYYWGHNAIIRMAPFMKHCGLGRLSGDGPMGGEILSHDFVEAAYMRRAGWEVWLAHELGGSYEESPPTLLDELKRDRRWAQGNLQHLRLLNTWGLRFAHRIMFLYGVMAYGSSFLWLALLVFSTVAIVSQAKTVPVYFSDSPSLFPHWPTWHPEWGLALLLSTAALLFIPKLLAVILVLLKSGGAKAHGGAVGVILSTLGEILYSMVLAPVRMLFHAKFVSLTLIGKSVQWGPQTREDEETTWREAWYHHRTGTLLAIGWAALVAWYNPPYLIWLAPIIIALLLAVPVSVISSRTGVGRKARTAGLFMIPTETREPQEIAWTNSITQKNRADLQTEQMGGFVRAVVDPAINALHLSLLPKQEQRPELTERHLRQLRERVLAQGPSSLSATEKRTLLSDAQSMAWLHTEIWGVADTKIARRWHAESLLGVGP